MKTRDLILIGGLCIAGYFLWKQLNGEGFDWAGFGGGGGGGAGDIPSTLPPGVPPPAGTGTRNTTTSPVSTAGTPAASSWTGVTYGQPGQPSVPFLYNTIKAAKAPGASETTKMAAAAAYAGAPPRVVAKIKAGKFY